MLAAVLLAGGMRLDAVEVAVEIDLQRCRWMIAWPAGRLRGHPLKTQLPRHSGFDRLNLPWMWFK
jgi:hypothetical protein